MLQAAAACRGALVRAPLTCPTAAQPRCRGFFLYCFHATPAALAVLLALRFPRRPLLCLLFQALANCLLGPWPTYGDIALWLVSSPEAAEPHGACLGVAAGLAFSVHLNRPPPPLPCRPAGPAARGCTAAGADAGQGLVGAGLCSGFDSEQRYVPG